MKRRFIDFLSYWKVPILILKILNWVLVPVNAFSQDTVLVDQVSQANLSTQGYEPIGSYKFTSTGNWRLRDCKIDFAAGFENISFVQIDTGNVSYLGAATEFLSDPYVHSLDIPLFSESRTLHYFVEVGEPLILEYTFTCFVESMDGSISYWTEPVTSSFSVGVGEIPSKYVLEVSSGIGGVFILSENDFDIYDILGNKIFSHDACVWKFVPISEKGLYIVKTKYLARGVQSF